MAESNIRFLVNPSSGRGTGRAHLDRIRVLASRLGAGLCVSRKVSDLAEQARRAAEDGVERLLVAGGTARCTTPSRGWPAPPAPWG